MARKPSGRPNGRPKSQIDWTMFENLCSLHCTSEEIASFLKVHVQTLREHVQQHYGEAFSLIYKRFIDAGKCSLRRHQWVIAKKNASMAIWLGKQYLGQKDDYPEAGINENAVVQFNALMKQLEALQTPPSARKMEESNINAAAKS